MGAKSSTAKAMVYNEAVQSPFVFTNAGVQMPRLIYGTGGCRATHLGLSW